MLRRHGPLTAALLAAAVLLGAVAVIGKMWWDSRLPGTYSVLDHGHADYGGGPVGSHASHEGPTHSVDVTKLHGPRTGAPDARFALSARQATIRLASGRTVDGLTFNGKSPGPELRVRQGDLVEVTLRNEDVGQGVTIHWHGVDVPNAEDGVAGVTQDAVVPGASHAYRFRAEQVGTFWYHSHQVSSSEVRRGLFGAFVIEPRATEEETLDLSVVGHTFDGIPTVNGSDDLAQRAVPPGTPVRLRLVNTDNTELRFALGGTPFRVVAIDGTDLVGPTTLEDTALGIGGGGRMDVAFTMPASPVLLSLVDTSAGIAFSADGRASPAAAAPSAVFDPLAYGRRAATPFDGSSSFDRRFTFTISRKPGFYDGDPGLQWAINGGIYPDVPMFVVERGDLVEVTITNDSDAIHPMHLHGHHLLVLSRDGVDASGSPWWVDTLNMQPGERYVLAFRADNPGIWMDHCHNLTHAATGLTMHVAYAGVTTRFLVGDDAHNDPE